jgi:hypothetical protein
LRENEVKKNATSLNNYVGFDSGGCEECYILSSGQKTLMIGKDETLPSSGS